MAVEEEEGFYKFLSIPSINQSVDVFDVLGGNWDPTDKRFSTVNSCRQDYLPAYKAFPKDAPHAFGSHKVVKSATGTTLLQEV